MLGIILFGGFFLFLAMGIPVGFGLTLASLAAILTSNYPIAVLDQRMFTAVNSFPLMAIPLFMLAGSLMSHGGITRRIIDFALAFVGGIRGSLGHVVAISGIIMGGISGSGVADAAALGSVMIPEMKKRLRPASKIAGAHGRGERQPVDPPEGLNLKRTDKRNQRIHDKIKLAARNEKDRKKTGDLQQNDRLIPRDSPSGRQAVVNHFRREHAQCVKQDCKQIPGTPAPVPVREGEAEQNHVSRHRVCKDMAPVKIGVNIQKSARAMIPVRNIMKGA